MGLVFAVAAFQSAGDGRGQDGKSTKDQKRLMEAPDHRNGVGCDAAGARMI